MTWKEETDDIMKRRALAREQGGATAIAAQHRKGRLTIRERIDALLDADSFDEIGMGAGDAELDENGKLLPPDTLRSRFESHGVTPDKRVIALCNTGYRSAHAYWALRLLGYPDVRNYVGSWQEWGNREGCPVVTPAG